MHDHVGGADMEGSSKLCSSLDGTQGGWPQEAHQPQWNAGVPVCSVPEFAEAARAVWEMGGWAAEEPASAFLQSSTEDVTFGRWLPEQALEPEQAPPDRPAPEQGCNPLQMRPPTSMGGSAEQRQEHVQSGQSTEGSHRGPQQAPQPQEAEQQAGGTGPPAQQQSHSVSIQMSGENPADLLAAITNALSNQERDSTDHLVPSSASTGSMSSLVVPALPQSHTPCTVPDPFHAASICASCCLRWASASRPPSARPVCASSATGMAGHVPRCLVCQCAERFRV